MNALLNELIQVLGPGHATTDGTRRALMATDIGARGVTPAIIASPADTAELARAVGIAARHLMPMLPRGGGMSYTGGYISQDKPALLLDLGRMNRILDIDVGNMTLRVEAGTTWKQVHDALTPLGLRTPFWGPLSGLASTVGGALSQNSTFFGAGIHGPSPDSALALSVVLADGSILRTDQRRADGTFHAFRSYGPDLTGLFLGDCGALGIKAEATLRLIPRPEAEDWLSFAFAERDACAEALAAMAREGVACELFGFDPDLARVRMRRASLLADAAQLAKVVTAQKSVVQGIREGARMALAGRSFLDDAAYSIHAVVEGRARAAVEAGTARLRAIARRHGGTEIGNTIPKVMRANPFTPLNSILGPGGERWAPIHGIVSLRAGPVVWANLDSLFSSMAPRFEAEGISTGYLVTTIGTTGFLIEPVFYWPDERYPLHEATVEQAYMRTLPAHQPGAGARALVGEARQHVLRIFEAAGAAHFQIGRTYSLAATRDPAALALLKAVKATLDPNHLMNPGVLDLT